MRQRDVLSFATFDDDPTPGAELELGSVVVSRDSARRQAESLGHSVDEELAVLVAHGLLHLLGFDHERSLADALGDGRARDEPARRSGGAAGVGPDGQAAALVSRGSRRTPSPSRVKAPKTAHPTLRFALDSARRAHLIVMR